MKPIPRRMSAIIDRARLGLGKKAEYAIGRGGFSASHPNDPLWDDHRSDCSGFLSFVMQTHRNPKPPTRPFWIETTAMCGDAAGKQLVFVKLTRPVPGCYVAYPDSRSGDGHCAVVTEVHANGSYDGVDCSHGSWARTGDAIRERPLSLIFDPQPGRVFFVLREDLA